MSTDSALRLLMPSLDELESVLSNLLNAPVRGDRLRKGEVMPDGYLSGLYHDQDDILRAIIQVDFAFALDCGARLSMIPVGVVEETKASGQLTETMTANVHEILNIFGLLFNEQRPGAPRVRLVALVGANELPDEARALLGHPKVQGIDARISWKGIDARGFLSVRMLPFDPRG